MPCMSNYTMMTVSSEGLQLPISNHSIFTILFIFIFLANRWSLALMSILWEDSQIYRAPNIQFFCQQTFSISVQWRWYDVLDAEFRQPKSLMGTFLWICIYKPARRDTNYVNLTQHLSFWYSLTSAYVADRKGQLVICTRVHLYIN